MTADIQKNVVYFGPRWRKCNADLLLVSVILCTLITCAHPVSCVRFQYENEQHVGIIMLL